MNWKDKDISLEFLKRYIRETSIEHEEQKDDNTNNQSTNNYLRYSNISNYSSIKASSCASFLTWSTIPTLMKSSERTLPYGMRKDISPLEAEIISLR